MKKDDLNNNKNQEEEKIPLNKKTMKFILTIVTFTLLLSWILNHTSSFTGILGNILSLLSPFLVGACISFIINTLLKPLEKLWEKVPLKKRTKLFSKAKRPVCLTFSTLIVFGVVFLVLFMIIPQLVETVATFANTLPQYIKNLEGLLDKLMKTLENYNIVITSYDLLKRDIEIYKEQKYEFQYIIADEAQYIKNNNTQNAIFKNMKVKIEMC